MLYIVLEEFAKAISGKKGGLTIGRNNLLAVLRADKILKDNNLPYQRYIDSGWLVVAEKSYDRESTNGPRLYFKIMLKGRGQLAVFDRLKNSVHLSKHLNKSARCNTVLVGGKGRV